ncbi:ATP-binding protein [Microbacterium sp. SORGH_AS_0888]|uniref:sensor histidine kinase n=1 Tax=Microbacterium sp. SORGH_AS_0888 TaxID=3041791 RepID=UPI00278197ED|nr:ATP-binding protein [Microbacterium sp. SORGH_AS_0888]MDQ1130499.1 two-component system phosphate regulon sensor histidine kinase PhoR [Microbacterium sp. SORGH_AS_0888]
MVRGRLVRRSASPVAGSPDDVADIERIFRTQPFLQWAFLASILLATAVRWVTGGGFSAWYPGMLLAVVALTALVTWAWRSQLAHTHHALFAVAPVADLLLWPFLRHDLIQTLVQGTLTVVLPLVWLWVGFSYGVALLGGAVLAAATILVEVATQSVEDGWRNALLVVNCALLTLTCAAVAAWMRTVQRRAMSSGTLLRQLLQRNDASTAALDAILQSSTDAIAVLDEKGRILRANEATHRLAALAGVRPMPGGYDRILARGLDGEAIDFAIDTFAERFPSGIPVRIGPEGVERVVSLTMQPIVAPAEERIGTLVIAHDVTALTEALDSRSDYLRTASHELRTPLSIIVGQADLLLETTAEASPETRRRAVDILRAADRLSAVVAALHDAASPHVPMQPTRFDVARLLAAVGARSAVHLAAPAEPAFAFADMRDAERVLVELVSNATRHSGAPHTVQVHARAEGESVVIDVLDEGVGIPDSEEEHVFEPFYRGSAAHRDAVAGIGLGLPVARKVARANNGEVLLVTRGGGGLVARLRLPRAASP